MHHRQIERRLSAILARRRPAPSAIRAIVERLAGAPDAEASRILDELQRHHSAADLAKGADLAAFVAAALDATEGDEHAVVERATADE